MQLRISTMIQDCELSHFTLQGGYGGLQNPVIDVGILDHEYDLSPIVKQKKFEKNSFVVSSMLFAKNDPEKLMLAVRNLVLEQVSGLGIQSIYFSKLPQEVMDFADTHNFPIFIIEKAGDYLENIIFKIKRVIHESYYFDYQEIKIQQAFMLASERGREKLLLEASVPAFEVYQALYLTHLDYADIPNLELVRLKNNPLNQKNLVTRMGKGILILVGTTKQAVGNITESKKRMLALINQLQAGYNCGVSGYHYQLSELKQALEECRLALKVGSSSQHISFYDELGVFKLIAAVSETPEMERFVIDTIELLKKDHEGNLLLETLLCYFNYKGDIKACGKVLFVHPNTVRYRIKKALTILDYQNEFELISELSVILKLYQVLMSGE